MLTWWKQVKDKALGEEHLATAQHAAPATVTGESGASQLGEAFAVGQP